MSAFSAASLMYALLAVAAIAEALHAAGVPAEPHFRGDDLG